MDRKAKRNKEVHTATIKLLAGTRVSNLLSGLVFITPKTCDCSAWYLVEKGQWFYWTVFYTNDMGEECLIMVRRDFVTIKPGTHLLSSRVKVQQKMDKILKNNTLEHMRLPRPPKKPTEIKNIKETCPQEWKRMYTQFNTLACNRFFSRPSTEEGVLKRQETFRKKALEKELLKKVEAIELEDDETSDLD